MADKVEALKQELAAAEAHYATRRMATRWRKILALRAALSEAEASCSALV